MDGPEQKASNQVQVDHADLNTNVGSSLLKRLAGIATLGVTGLAAQAAKADIVLLDQIDDMVAEGWADSLATNAVGSSVFETLGAGSQFYGFDRTITSLAYIGSIQRQVSPGVFVQGDWDTLDWRIGRVTNPGAYNTADHAATQVGGYSLVAEEIFRAAPSNSDFKTPIGQINGSDIFRLEFEGLDFDVGANTEFTPIISTVAANGVIGDAAFKVFADAPTDGWIADNLFTNGNTIRLSEATFTSGNASSLAYSVGGTVNGVPEPSSAMLLGLAIGGFTFHRGRRLPLSATL